MQAKRQSFGQLSAIWASVTLLAGTLSAPVHAQTRDQAAEFLKPYLTNTNSIVLRTETFRYRCEDASIRAGLGHILAQADLVMTTAQQRGVGVATTVEMSSAVLNRAADYMSEASQKCGMDYRREIGALNLIVRRNDAVLRQVRDAERRANASSSRISPGEAGAFLQGLAGAINAARGTAQGGQGNGLTCQTDFEVTC